MAVILQIRSSSREVRDQIKAQRDAEKEEMVRQKRAVATAVLYEIESFFMLELEQVEKTLSAWDSVKDPILSSACIRQNSFDIYKMNSLMLGRLNAKSISAIVKWYTMAETFVELVRQYERYFEWAYTGVNSAQSEKIARQRLTMLRDLIPALKGLTTSVTTSVARDCGLSELIAGNDAEAH